MILTGKRLLRDIHAVSHSFFPVATRVKALLIVMLFSTVYVNSQTLNSFNETKLYIKEGLKHKATFKFDYYDHGPDFEKKCIEFLFRDTMSSSLIEAMESYCKQFERETEHERCKLARPILS
jgi:hypothetical protein